MQAAWNAPITTDAELAHLLEVVAPLYFYTFDADRARRLFGKIVYNAAAMTQGGQLYEEHNVTPWLGEIQAPTLILVGRDDFICPPSQAAIMHAGIPNAQLVIFEQSGHFPYVEEPDIFFAAVRAWFDQTA
jgi:proline iminopeptidase